MTKDEISNKLDELDKSNDLMDEELTSKEIVYHNLYTEIARLKQKMRANRTESNIMKRAYWRKD